MTHVRLPIVVDKERPQLCGDCSHKTRHGECSLFGLLSEDYSVVGGKEVVRGKWWRAKACVEASSLDAARERVVEAARVLADSITRSSTIESFRVAEASDALRELETR